jgi:hypothetical protein
MDNKKFESLIELIINENEEQARALFHDIVVEKSREIYESMMYEEVEDLEEEKDKDDADALEEGADDDNELEEGFDQMGGGNMDQVEGLLDEIGAEEQGMTEEDDEMGDIEMGDDDMGGEENLEDRVVDLEDKLDELMAEFEEMMGGEGGEEDFGDEEGMGDMGDEEDMGDMGDEDEAAMMEAVQLQKVSVTHGDNGVQTKSPTLGANKKISSNGAKPVATGFQDSGKGGTQGGLLNPTTKDLKGANNFKNSPGKGNFSEKGEAAPKPKHGDDGQNTKSITSESRKMVKKPLSQPAKKIVK